MKIHPRQSRSFENSHAKVLALPGLSRRRKVQVKCGNLICDCSPPKRPKPKPLPLFGRLESTMKAIRKMPLRVGAGPKTSGRDDPAQSRAFIKKAREVGADDGKSASGRLVRRLAKMPPEPRKPKREK